MTQTQPTLLFPAPSPRVEPAAAVGLSLPDWITDHSAERRPSAGIEYGCRYVAWVIDPTDPVTIFRNQLTWAHVQVSEREAWRGEPLRLLAHRRQGSSYVRDSFTAAGRDAMEADLIPRIARYGFDRLWNETRSASYRDGGSADRARTAQANAERVARWHADTVEVIALLADGCLDIRGIPPRTAHTTSERDARRVAYVDGSGRPAVGERIADLYLDGELVGHLLPDGTPIPLDDDIQRYWNRPIRPNSNGERPPHD